MKKTIIGMLVALTMFVSGCDWDETAVIATAKTSGSICLLTWFSIDNPDVQVKTTLKEVITFVENASVKVVEGESYLDSLLPYIQKFVGEQEKLNDYQKQLINAGAVVVLNGIDTFMATNPKVKADAEMVNKVVGAFCQGCLSVLNMPEDCEECQRAKAVYQMRSMKCRDGKFVIEQ